MPWYPQFEAIRNDFRQIYALEEDKFKSFGWRREGELERLRVALSSLGAVPPLYEAQRTFRTFFLLTRDYHSDIFFVGSDAAAELPIGVRTAEDRTYLTYIDRRRLSTEVFPFHLGDEIVSFGGRSTADVLRGLTRAPVNHRATDLADADRLLTRRPGYLPGELPSGPIEIGILRKGESKPRNAILEWVRIPKMRLSEMERVYRLNPVYRQLPLQALEDSIRSRLEKREPDLLNELGNRKPFVPPIGEVQWETSAAYALYARIERMQNGKRIGFVRVPTYLPSDPLRVIQDFERLMEKFENETDLLIYDQTHNAGGSMLFFYELLSRMIDRPVKVTLRWEYRLNETNFHFGVKWEDLIQKLERVKTDADAVAVLGTHLRGYPVDYRFAMGVLAEARAVRMDQQTAHSQWPNRVLSRPLPLAGVTQVYPKGRPYTKPIMMLANYWSFSSADMAPAMMQDLRRAVIFGERTPGAGAYVTARPASQSSNAYRVWFHRLSFARVTRAGGKPLENVGCSPDIAYRFTAEDFRDGLQGYVQALRRAVESLHR